MKYGAFTRLMVATLLGLLATPLGLAGQNEQATQDSTRNDEHEHFRVRSTTFEDGTELPLSMINNILNNGVNTCTPNGGAGGNQSPELSWTPGKHGTKSYVVVMYDVTAAFTHWGMYNISPETTSLPENAGVAGSTYGAQIFNDFFAGAEYDGPCPPATAAPLQHHYVITGKRVYRRFLFVGSVELVYALDVELNLPSSANFPAGAETLFRALLEAARNDHVLESACIGGFYSSAPSN